MMHTFCVLQDGKLTAAVTVRDPHAPIMPVPGPGGDAPQAVEECFSATRALETRRAPPNQLEVRLVHQKGGVLCVCV